MKVLIPVLWSVLLACAVGGDGEEANGGGAPPPQLAALQIRLYRELQIPPYRLLCRVYEDLVVVLAVFDGRRDLEDVILERLLSV